MDAKSLFPEFHECSFAYSRLGVSSSRSDGNDGEGNEEGPWEVDSSVPAEDESILKLNPGAELSLLSFNLEPLTDTLEELDLSSNQFSGLPSQFVNRTFARLRKLNLAQNPLKGGFLKSVKGVQ